MQKEKIEDPILLDTHVMLWVLLKPEEISEAVRKTISSAQSNYRLFLSSISLWEIAMLRSKKRINIYEPIKNFLQSIESIRGIDIINISSAIAAESTLLIDGFHGDPADRIIVATAVNNGATLLTRDRKILSWAELGNIKAIEA